MGLLHGHARGQSLACLPIYILSYITNIVIYFIYNIYTSVSVINYIKICLKRLGGKELIKKKCF